MVQHSDIRERPIICTGESVLGILEDRKTKTRRVIKPQPEKRRHSWAMTFDNGVLSWGRAPWYKTDPFNHLKEKEVKCPYGKVGDYLWLRETWAVCKDNDHLKPSEIWYDEADSLRYKADSDIDSSRGRWRSPIHMPRWASRIILEITDLRVERLQDISEEDAIAEGVKPDKSGYWQGAAHPVKGTPKAMMDAIAAFRSIWDSLNKKRGFGWDKNPWCWCITFRRIKED